MFWLGLGCGVLIYLIILGVLTFVQYHKVKKERKNKFHNGEIVNVEVKEDNK